MTSRTFRRVLIAAVSLVLAVVAPPRAGATPSTTFWAPTTPYVQPYGVLHVTYDTYFGSTSAYPVTTGLTMGVFPWKGLQSEVGFDLVYPSVSADGPVDAPFVLNGKVGAPEDTYFKGQPGWSFGIYGVGLESHFNDQNALYGCWVRRFPSWGRFRWVATTGSTRICSDRPRARSSARAFWPGGRRPRSTCPRSTR